MTQEELNKAAKIGGEKEYPIIQELTDDGKDLFAHKQVAFRKGFIAGYNFAMGQGETYESEVIKDYDLRKGTILSIKVEDVDKEKYCEAERVIVQIRKKDE